MSGATRSAGRACRAAVTLVLYAALAIASTWPLASRLSTSVVVGSEVARTVPLFNVWTIWWNCQWMGTEPVSYWDAPIFYPEENSFALSEPQPITMALTPLVAAGASIFAAANLYLLISLTLNGWVAERFLVAMGIRRVVAVGGGVAMLLLPIAHWQMGVLQLVPLWGILLTWWMWNCIAGQESVPDDRSLEVDPPLERHTRPKSLAAPWAIGAGLGIAFSSVMASSVHHALFLALVLIVTLPLFGNRLLSSRTWIALLTAAVVAAVLCGWMIWGLRAMPVEDNVRPRKLIDQLSLRLGDYAAIYGHSLLQWGRAWTREGWYGSPGWLKWPLAAAGIFFLLRPRPTGEDGGVNRRWGRMLIAILCVSAFFSFGSNLHWRGFQPWWWVSDYVPGFAQVRNVFRFAYFVQMVVVLLAAAGVDGLARWWIRRASSAQPTSTRWRWAGLAILIVLGIGAAFDPWPPKPVLAAVPNELAHRDWMTWLRDASNRYRSESTTAAREPARGQLPPKFGVLCLPMAQGSDVRDFEITTEWMIFSSQHGVPLVNGYSGFFPQGYFDVRNTVNESGVTAELMNRLYAEGVRWVVVDHQRLGAEWPPAVRLGDIAVIRQFTSRRNVSVYQLGVVLSSDPSPGTPPPGTPPPDGRPPRR